MWRSDASTFAVRAASRCSSAFAALASSVLSASERRDSSRSRSDCVYTSSTAATKGTKPARAAASAARRSATSFAGSSPTAPKARLSCRARSLCIDAQASPIQVTVMVWLCSRLPATPRTGPISPCE